MGTRADFYVGRGPEAEWLGSIGYDGYPGGIGKEVLESTSEEGFRAAVAKFFAECDHHTEPSQGWPWPWNDSHLTDYSYAFDGNEVWCSSFGKPWFQVASGDEPTYYESWEEFDKDMVASHFDEEEIEDARKHAIVGPGNTREDKCPLCRHEMHPTVVFPDMTERKRLTLGHRSGLLVIGI